VQQLADAVLKGKAEAATMGQGKAEAGGTSKEASPGANGHAGEEAEMEEKAAAAAK
jgi:hypothetical protein